MLACTVTARTASWLPWQPWQLGARIGRPEATSAHREAALKLGRATRLAFLAGNPLWPQSRIQVTSRAAAKRKATRTRAALIRRGRAVCPLARLASSHPRRSHAPLLRCGRRRRPGRQHAARRVGTQGRDP
eukprot:364310-Chlamydomonas_euryale.AAC.7